MVQETEYIIGSTPYEKVVRAKETFVWGMKKVFGDSRFDDPRPTYPPYIRVKNPVRHPDSTLFDQNPVLSNTILESRINRAYDSMKSLNGEKPKGYAALEQYIFEEGLTITERGQNIEENRERIKKLIKEDFRKLYIDAGGKYTLAKGAKDIGISVAELRSIVGKNATRDYTAQARASRYNKMLEDFAEDVKIKGPKLKITDFCYAHGIKSTSTFYTAVKKQYGTMDAFREKLNTKKKKSESIPQIEEPQSQINVTETNVPKESNLPARSQISSGLNYADQARLQSKIEGKRRWKRKQNRKRNERIFGHVVKGLKRAAVIGATIGATYLFSSDNQDQSNQIKYIDTNEPRVIQYTDSTPIHNLESKLITDYK